MSNRLGSANYWWSSSFDVVFAINCWELFCAKLKDEFLIWLDASNTVALWLRVYMPGFEKALARKLSSMWMFLRIFPWTPLISYAYSSSSEKTISSSHCCIFIGWWLTLALGLLVLKGFEEVSSNMPMSPALGLKDMDIRWAVNSAPLPLTSSCGALTASSCASAYMLSRG